MPQKRLLGAVAAEDINGGEVLREFVRFNRIDFDYFDFHAQSYQSGEKILRDFASAYNQRGIESLLKTLCGNIEFVQVPEHTGHMDMVTGAYLSVSFRNDNFVVAVDNANDKLHSSGGAVLCAPSFFTYDALNREKCQEISCAY